MHENFCEELGRLGDMNPANVLCLWEPNPTRLGAYRAGALLCDHPAAAPPDALSSAQTGRVRCSVVCTAGV